MEEKVITLSFTKKELENLNYALNCAQIHVHELGLPDWCHELGSLWLRIYDVEKSL